MHPHLPVAATSPFSTASSPSNSCNSLLVSQTELVSLEYRKSSQRGNPAATSWSFHQGCMGVVTYWLCSCRLWRASSSESISSWRSPPGHMPIAQRPQSQANTSERSVTRMLRIAEIQPTPQHSSAIDVKTKHPH